MKKIKQFWWQWPKTLILNLAVASFVSSMIWMFLIQLSELSFPSTNCNKFNSQNHPSLNLLWQTQENEKRKKEKKEIKKKKKFWKKEMHQQFWTKNEKFSICKESCWTITLELIKKIIRVKTFCFGLQIRFPGNFFIVKSKVRRDYRRWLIVIVNIR